MNNQTQIMRIWSLLTELEVLIEGRQEYLYIANSEQLIKILTKTDLKKLLDPDFQEIVRINERNLESIKLAENTKSKFSSSYFMSLFGSKKEGESPKKDQSELMQLRNSEMEYPEDFEEQEQMQSLLKHDFG